MSTFDFNANDLLVQPLPQMSAIDLFNAWTARALGPSGTGWRPFAIVNSRNGVRRFVYTMNPGNMNALGWYCSCYPKLRARGNVCRHVKMVRGEIDAASSERAEKATATRNQMQWGFKDRPYVEAAVTADPPRENFSSSYAQLSTQRHGEIWTLVKDLLNPAALSQLVGALDYDLAMVVSIADALANANTRINNLEAMNRDLQAIRDPVVVQIAQPGESGKRQVRVAS